MQKENISTDLNVYANSASTPKQTQLATAFLLGFVLLYGAGFVQTSVAHNASHDVRHAYAFPCH